MPQLYENQVQARASQNTYGKAPQINDYIGKALNNVAELSDEVSHDLQRVEDARLKAEVDSKTKQALEFIERADPKDFNYEETVQQASAIYNSAFDGANEATVSRFNRMNPEHATLMDLATNKVALEKTRERVIDKVNSDIPKFASDTVLGYMNEVEFDQLLQAYPLDSRQRTALKDKYKHDVDVGKVQFAIAGHDWKTATDLLNATEKTNTLSAEERYRLAQSIESSSHEAARRIKEKKDNFQDLQIDVLKNHVKAMQLAGNNAGAAEVIDRIANGEELVVEYGGIKVNTKDIAPLALDEAIRDMRGFDQKGSQAQMTKANAVNRADEIIRVGKEQVKNGSLQDRLRVSADVNNYITERGGYLPDLTSEQRQDLEYLRRSVATDLLENTLSARETTVYRTGAGFYNTAAYAPNIDLSLTTAGVVGALSPEEMSKVKDDLMSRGDQTASLEMTAARLEDKVLTGDLKPGNNTVGKFAEYTYLSLVTASPATLSKMGLPSIAPQRVADAYERFLNSATYNKDAYKQDINTEEGFNIAQDVFNSFLTSIYGTTPNFTPEQEHAVFALKSGIFGAAKGYGVDKKYSKDIPYYTQGLHKGYSSSMLFGLIPSERSMLMREADVAYPEAARKNFLNNKEK